MPHCAPAARNEDDTLPQPVGSVDLYIDEIKHSGATRTKQPSRTSRVFPSRSLYTQSHKKLLYCVCWVPRRSEPSWPHASAVVRSRPQLEADENKCDYRIWDSDVGFPISIRDIYLLPRFRKPVMKVRILQYLSECAGIDCISSYSSLDVLTRSFSLLEIHANCFNVYPK